jgi:hypothetical protein
VHPNNFCNQGIISSNICHTKIGATNTYNQTIVEENTSRVQHNYTLINHKENAQENQPTNVIKEHKLQIWKALGHNL